MKPSNKYKADQSVKMASLGDRRKHVLFIDSRGSLLQEALSAAGVRKTDFLIKHFPGAKIQALIREMDEYAKQFPFDVLYLAGGINNVTVKCKITKVVTFEWQSVSALSNFLITTMKKALKYLRREHPATKIVISSIPGVDLQYVVPCPTDRDQEIVTESIWNFNVEVRAVNKELGHYHPRLERPVHRLTNGTRRNYYHHLDDGLHSSAFMVTKWVQELIKSMGHN